MSFWLHSFCGKLEGRNPANVISYTIWVDAVTPTDRPKFFRNRCEIGVFVAFLCCHVFSLRIVAFIIHDWVRYLLFSLIFRVCIDINQTDWDRNGCFKCLNMGKLGTFICSTDAADVSANWHVSWLKISNIPRDYYLTYIAYNFYYFYTISQGYKIHFAFKISNN